MVSATAVDGRFNVRVWRQGTGAPVLFLHGFEGHPIEAPFLSRLAQHYTVYAPELPGYGGSTENADQLEDTEDYALYYRRFIEDVAGEPVALIGHDLGGMLAAEVAALSPHLVRKLVLVDAYGLWLDEHQIPDVFIQTPEALAELVWAQPAGTAAEQASTRAKEDLEQAALALRMQQNRAVAAKFLWAIPDRGLAKRLPFVQAPTLIVWGECDRLIPPAYAEAFRSRIAGAHVQIIKGAGHMPQIEQPEAFAAAVEAFLAS